MTKHVNIGGVWKEVNSQSVKVSGSWKNITQEWVKINGVWKKNYQYLPSTFTLGQTFTSSGTYTVPSNIYQLTIIGCGSGASGSAGAGSSGSFYGGAGGGSGAGFCIKNYDVTPGQTFSVTIGGIGASTSFGSLVTASPASGRNGGTVSATVSAEILVNGATGGSQTPGTGYASNGAQGTAGLSSTSLVSSAPGVATFAYGGAGGSGGGGGNTFAGSGVERFGGGGGGGGSSFGGFGGGGARAFFNTSGFSLSNGAGGSGATGPGGGGGGGGGGAQNGSQITNGGGGGAGASGRILVYVR